MKDNEKENRIAVALRLRNMKQVELCEKTGLSKSAINNWVKQRWQPKQTPVFLMAKALDVSEMWLAGYDCPMERSEMQKKNDALTDIVVRLRSDEDFAIFCEKAGQLSPEQFASVKQLVDTFLSMKG